MEIDWKNIVLKSYKAPLILINIILIFFVKYLEKILGTKYTYDLIGYLLKINIEKEDIYTEDIKYIFTSPLDEIILKKSYPTKQITQVKNKEKVNVKIEYDNLIPYDEGTNIYFYYFLVIISGKISCHIKNNNVLELKDNSNT